MTAGSTPTRWRVGIAWALLGVCVVLGVSQAVIGIAAGQSFRELAAPTANVTAFGVFAVVGSALAARRPRLVIGWLLLVIALSVVLESYLIQYAIAAPVIGLPLAATAEWLGFLVWGPSMAGVVALLLVFPDGRLPSARWRWVLVPVVGGLASLAAGAVLAWPLRGQLDDLGTDAAPIVLGDLAFFAFGLGILGGLAALIVRFRRSDGVERTQIAWLGYATATMVAFLGVALSLPAELAEGGFLPLDLASPFAPALLAVAIWIAVTRHRLYELDRVVSRTVTYGLVLTVLVGVYAVAVVTLQAVLRPVTGESDLAVAASTLAVAALFGPLRRRVQSAVDRRFDRSAYDAARTAERFGQRLRDQVDLDAVAHELRQTTAATVQPATVSLWTPTMGPSR